MKQLEQELIRSDLVEWHHRRVPKRRIGLVGHAPEVGGGNLSPDERRNHLDRYFPIGAAEQPDNGLGFKLGPNLRHVKSAVAGKPGQHHITKSQSGSLSSRRNVLRQAVLQRRGLPANL